VNKAVKINVYKMVVKAVVVCGSATWAMSDMDMNRLGAGQRKI
jgi:hypothetical protein